MTPKEFDWWCAVLEGISARAYTTGHEDGAANRSLDTDKFKLSKESRLTLKTNFEKATKRR